MELEPARPNTHLTETQRLRFRIWLQKQFELRRQRNARYSLRAFAATLQMDASSLSQMLSGKRTPSKKVLLSICQRLTASPKELRMMSLLDDSTTVADDAFQLSADTFAVISEWYHFALLELTFIAGFKSDPKWIASQLKISVTEVKAAIDRLVRLNLLKNHKGVLSKTHEVLTNHTGLQTSTARKNLQRQIISKALSAVDETPQEEKDITSMTMAIDPKNLDRARELIKKFRRDLCLLLEDGEPSQVFNLGVQLYPVSKKTKEHL